jgi:hypothetical protein
MREGKCGMGGKRGGGGERERGGRGEYREAKCREAKEAKET